MNYNEVYQGLNHNDATALNETIMDAGITSFPDLEAAWNMATKFLEEQKLSFKQFQATRRAMSATLEWCDANGLDFPAEVLVYDEECFIKCCSDGTYYLIIGNEDWIDSDLEKLEDILFNRWYI